MRVARFEDVRPADPVSKGFRGGDIQFRDLLTGVPGTPDNYGLQWVEVDGAFHTPRHRHNFEQIRILLEGEFGFGPGQTQKAGSVGYFCEGTYYTQDAKGRSVTLLLQVGGPSGQGFMTRAQLRDGVEALKAKGQFSDGVYTWHDENGKKHNQDSYEAAWEHVHGRAIQYPKPQFDAPVLFQPERFAWTPCPGQAGVHERRLARFHDKGLEMAQLRLDEGASHRFAASSRTWLLVCSQGEGHVDGEPYGLWTAMECGKGESLRLEAARPSVFWLIGLPDFQGPSAPLG